MTRYVWILPTSEHNSLWTFPEMSYNTFVVFHYTPISHVQIAPDAAQPTKKFCTTLVRLLYILILVYYSNQLLKIWDNCCWPSLFNNETTIDLCISLNTRVPGVYKNNLNLKSRRTSKLRYNIAPLKCNAQWCVPSILIDVVL